jgi:dihydrofolate reductase
MQAPGRPEEDPTGGFKHGGWVAGYFDVFLDQVMMKQMGRPFDLLLGRRTYEIFAAYWPCVKADGDPVAAGINHAKKQGKNVSISKCQEPAFAESIQEKNPGNLIY